jgi:SAM-dependent methyltransferase
MDQPGLDAAVHRRALADLARINRVSRSGAILWPAIAALAATEPNRRWSVLDIACGGGDVLLELAKRAQVRHPRIAFAGCDLSPVAVQHAQEMALASGFNSVRFFEHDALAHPLSDGYDVIVCSLFLHHLDETTAELLLRKMAAAARHLVLVNDLRRTRTGCLLAWIGCRLLSGSPVVHTDGPISARAAFTIHEVAELAARSGLAGAHISRRWPQRLLLHWKRP